MEVEQRKDLDELKRLHQLATRPTVKDLIEGHIQEIQRSLPPPKEDVTPTVAEPIKQAPVSQEVTPTKLPLKKITSYAWDQSDLYVKVYATNLSGVQSIPSENISCDFNPIGFNLIVKNLNGKDHQLQIVSLYGRIDPGQSKTKIKSDSVLVMLKKATKEKWEGMTEIDRKKKEKQKSETTPKADEDPSAGIMNLMKKMYDEGDDDMKRTIAKAWTESQDKKAAGAGVGDF